ncbi:MAG: 2-C-methyl-D-erythritol 2,4-cyclodiphosphate synthase [Nitrospirales bacterium]|nr:2-C-methyl-D-erythritol 2,4-cyclodiphosphate synthase [Nitrospirales bacterium]
MRIGIGYDSHRLVEGRRLILGGVEIPYEKGLLGHSDGDALCHAIIDAILGALGMGDIGKHFPDTEMQWKDASSLMLLSEILRLGSTQGFEISWLDCIIITEKPKMSPYMEKMKDALSGAGIPREHLNIKAKTNEGMGFIGKGEGIVAQAVCLLTR